MSIIKFVYTESIGSTHTIDFALLLNFPPNDSPSGGIMRPRVDSQFSITTQGESPQMGFSKVEIREIKPITYDDTTSCVHAYIGNNHIASTANNHILLRLNPHPPNICPGLLLLLQCKKMKVGCCC
jgi:hypothetical protein